MVRSTAVTAAPASNVLPLRQRPVDMDHLTRQALGDRELGKEILILFDQTAQTYFSRIERSTSVPELLMHLHTLKGAASGVGAWGIADLARIAESELRSGQPVNPERIDDIDMAVQEVSAFIAGL